MIDKSLELGKINTHYALLGLTPWANERQIRQAYRELSKLYHPDTTELPAMEAVEKFRQINDAYAILSSPERRSTYDRSIQMYILQVMQARQDNPYGDRSTQYDIDDLPIERPLSNGEIFVLLLMALTFLGCIALVVAVAWLRGDRLMPELVTGAAAYLHYLRVAITSCFYLNLGI
ncbi:heat shock protein DnaJ domain protein [Thalassoporum mexicanum PCC 7367]|uniref:J domain-containing protein n=1 Tax=Thalassoporum mexicanum TaxID=3457544 RepID=UPI00029F91EF|nr:J domain-containing protein [Pseudanabaena sp. PCC 7367]AFY69045.1 heat shock protein DnaJ domain protein [Pseudanabaena sp. PCC 7367]